MATDSGLGSHELGRPRTILDLGGATGPDQHGAEVTRLDHANLANDELLKAVGGRKFDLIVLGDALERLADPIGALRRLSTLLEDGGHVLVSVSRTPGATQRSVEEAGLQAMVVRSPKRFARGGAEKFLLARKPPKIGKLSLAVGMLTLNEEESVEKMIDEIRAYAPDATIILVDSSSDRTPDLARAKGAQVIRQLPPRGHGPAMEKLMYTAAAQCEALIYLDCDFTYPAEMIPRIRELLEQGADMVNASRTFHYPKAMPVPNFLANRLFAATAWAVHGVPTTDVHSGMRGYRSSMVRAFDFSGEGDALPLDTLILPAKSNYSVVEFPIEYHERVGVSKLARLRGTTWTFIRIANAIGEGKRVRRGRNYQHRS